MSDGTLLTAWEGMRTTIGAPMRRRAAHFGVLYETIWGLALQVRRDLPLSEASREEVAQACALALLEKTELAELPSDATVRAYLKTWIKNRLIDCLRIESRTRELGDGNHQEPVAPEPEEDPADDLRGIFDELPVRIVEPLYEGRPKRREAALNSYKEMLELARGDQEIEDLIGACDSTAEFNKKRNALYNRHQRLRDAMFKWIDKLEATGEMSREQAERYRKVVESLRRRRDQRRKDK